MTDPDSKSSNAQYDYDLGVAKVTTDPKTATLTRSYDGAGRVIRIDSNIGGYTRFVYPSSMTEVDTYVLQVAATQTTLAVEIFSAQFSDGAGRVITTRRELPGSTGGYSGQKFVYDVMGRLSQQSNPTEITNAGVPAGDDATAGWLYSSQTYDWKGRPRVTTNTDQMTRDITYGGCGCAGGEVVTVRDEVNRRQRMTYDVLGRLMKTEVLNSDLTTYSTTKNTYNARDQVTFIRQYQGTDTGATFQETAMTYDGYGRLGTRKAPIEDSGSVYAYYADDTVQKVIDPRGASSTFTYNGRHLVTGITYAKPGNSPQPDAITPVPSVAFGYDDAGNRLWMTDGLGRVDYVRDTWSRLTSETRTFNDFPGSTYPLTYDYNLAGELKSLTDPFGKAINYAYNQGGQLTGVTGSNFAGITQYASTMQYRAWGGLKHMVSGDGRSIDIGYSGRLQISSFAPSNNTTHSTYEYYGDGRVSFVHNLDNPSFDRKYSYDHAGRLNTGLTGTDARAEPYDSNNPNPYKQTYSYDVFSNMTGRTNRWWTLDEGSNTATYVNDRNTAWDYNAAGNVAHNPEGSYVYDAAGRMSKFNDPLLNQSYDGDGLPALRIENRLNLQDRATIYYIRSSVLAGQTITEVNEQGFKRRTYVYANGEEIARQEKRQTDSVVWISRNPITGDDDIARDPMGGYIGNENDVNFADYAALKGDAPTHEKDADPFDSGSGCTLDGVPIDCSTALGLVNHGAANFAPIDTIRPIYNSQLGTYTGFAAFDPYLGDFVRLTQIATKTKPPVLIRRSGRVSAPSGPSTDDDDVDPELQNAQYDPRADFRDYARSLSKQRGQRGYNDCLALALLIYKAGQIWNEAGPVVNGLLGGLTEFSDIGPLGGRPPSDPNYRVGVLRSDPYYERSFAARGFKREFQETGPGENQVRHFAFYFAAGFKLGRVAARYGLSRNENPYDATNPDVALGWAAIDAGLKLRGDNYRNVAQIVWHEICGRGGNLRLP